MLILLVLRIRFLGQTQVRVIPRVERILFMVYFLEIQILRELIILFLGLPPVIQIPQASLTHFLALDQAS